MSNLLFFSLMVLGGVAMTIQPSINARLAQRVGLIESACISFLIGAGALLLVGSALGKGSYKGMLAASWWELSGGILGALYVSLTILVVPRIGTASAMAAVITAQLGAGLLLDHFGMFGMRTVSLDARRIVGAALLMVGAVLIFRR